MRVSVGHSANHCGYAQVAVLFDALQQYLKYLQGYRAIVAF
jgi:hypothetical protein